MHPLRSNAAGVLREQQTNQQRVGRRKDVGCRPQPANVSQKQCGNVGRRQRSPGKRDFKAVSIRTGPRKICSGRLTSVSLFFLFRISGRYFSLLNSEHVREVQIGSSYDGSLQEWEATLLAHPVRLELRG
jgi:hypothetical protein